MNEKLTVEMAWNYFQAGDKDKAILLCHQIISQKQTLHVGEWNQIIEIFQQSGKTAEAQQISIQLQEVLNSDIQENIADFDPTTDTPGGYSLERADEVYGEAFRLCFEYLFNAGPQGPILEFGTFKGYTARHMAQLMQEFNIQENLYLYDSFKGFPEITSNVDQRSYEVVNKQAWLAGNMKLAPNMPDLIQKSLQRFIKSDQIMITSGFFDKVLPQKLPSLSASLIHIDCDLYESTRFVLEQLVNCDILQDGCLLLFDDFNCNRANPDMGERKAFDEFLNSQERFHASLFFNYGWNGKAFFIHDNKYSLT